MIDREEMKLTWSRTDVDGVDRMVRLGLDKL